MTLLVHIEGVNFEATVWDVNDLATQRGASLALLEAPKVLIQAAAEVLGAEMEEVFTGASIGRYLLHTDENAAKVEALVRDLAAHPTENIRSLGHLLPYLCFVAAAVDPKDYDDDMVAARRSVVAKARRAQLQTPTVVAPAPVDHGRLCALNPMLPTASPSKPYSASIEARREYGRQRKQGFYTSQDIHIPDGAVFAREIDDLVRDGPGHLPISVRNKVAHIYLDGNDFTSIRERIIECADEPLAAEKAFSEFVSTRRRRLLKRLVDDLNGYDDMFVATEDEDRIFRWETLLWGGDEAAFIVPAWGLPRLLPLLADELATDWTFEGKVFTHKGGIYVADRKTPIVLARRLAEALADSAKCGGASTAQIMISESVSPPVDVTRIGPDALCEYRDRLYGTGNPAYFTLDFGQTDDFIKGLNDVQAMPGGLPRSQLYGIIRENGPDPEAAFKRSEARCRHVFKQPWFGGGSDDPLLPFRRVAELLDYFPAEAS